MLAATAAEIGDAIEAAGDYPRPAAADLAIAADYLATCPVACEDRLIVTAGGYVMPQQIASLELIDQLCPCRHPGARRVLALYARAFRARRPAIALAA